MHEIELKLQVPAARRAEVEAAVAGRAPRARIRLQAWYHDCADRRLAAASLALRLRREGRRWVQTLKGAGDDGLTRAEHNVPRGTAAAMPMLDPTLHARTKVGERLLTLLAAPPAAALAPLYRTDIRRRTRVRPVRWPGGPSSRVELAFDRGRIEAGARVLDVSELEIELQAGAPRAVIETARRWMLRHGLWLDLRSKSERGDLLARGETVAPARGAQALQLGAAMSAAQAWQAALRNCADQILGNASQIASGTHDAEHVHQLRVGLRRLRSALALFEPGDASAALGSDATALFRQLGAARDRVVIEDEFAAELRAAMREAGVAIEPPVLAGSDTEAAPPELLRLRASQGLLLDLIEAMQPNVSADADDDATADAPPLRERLAARLNHWHRQVVADAKHYFELDDAQRHRLRKRAKRLRYATEFCAALFERRAVRRYLKALRGLQQRLGAITDTTMAMRAFAPRADTEPAAMFALGWLAARHAALVAASGPELKRFAKVRRYWREKPD
jgi:inorganic triphosphatase YgiF